MNTNSDVNPGPWAERTTPAHHTQATGKGVALVGGDTVEGLVL